MRRVSSYLKMRVLGAIESAPGSSIVSRIKHVSEQQLSEALSRQKRDGRKLGEVLVEMGACTYKQIYEALALQQRMVGGDKQESQKTVAPQRTAGSSENIC